MIRTEQFIIFIAFSTLGFVLGNNLIKVNYSTNYPVQKLENVSGFQKLTLVTKCWEDLGCVTSDEFFDSLIAINLVFADPEEMDVKFLLFTRQNRETPQEFNYKPIDSEITGSLFQANRKTKFIIHGWNGNFLHREWANKTKAFLLDKFDCNVIGVDWSKPASSPLYFPAAANARVVGRMIAHFVNRFINVTNATPKTMHCIGFSLGAHVCAFFGQRLQELSLPKLDEITGSDPAGPAFHLNDPDTRLDATDADLVVVIHTSSGVFTTESSQQLFEPAANNQGVEEIIINPSGILGNIRNLGHFDFWPNGGSKQPGCDNSQSFICNHCRAVEYPIARPKNGCQFIGYECDSYVHFEEGLCADCGPDNKKCKPQEYDFKFWDKLNRSQLSVKEEPKNNYHLKTSGSEPFCIFHYQIQVQIAKDSSPVDGKLEIKFSDRNVTFLDETKAFKEKQFKPDTKYNQLFVDQDKIAFMYFINVRWSSLSKKSIKVGRISFNYMSHNL